MLDGLYHNFIAQRPLKEIIKDALDYFKFNNMTYTLCAFDQLYKTTICKDYTNVTQTFQGTSRSFH